VLGARKSESENRYLSQRRKDAKLGEFIHVYIPMKSAPIPKQSGKHAEQIGSPGSRSEATLGFCS
jgi:hypothetical protein